MRLAQKMREGNPSLAESEFERCSTGALIALMGVGITENTPAGAAFEYLRFKGLLHGFEEMPSSKDLALEDVL